MEITTHYWLDGMDEDIARYYDPETNTIEQKTVYYGGVDGQNLAGYSANVDFTEEMCRLYIHNNRQKANESFAAIMLTYKQKVRKGSNVEVIKGRKVKIGTKLNVFWIGKKPTYFASKNPWCDETFTLLGCHDSNNKTVWIDADYVKVIDHINNPNAKVRKRIMNSYFDDIRSKVVK